MRQDEKDKFIGCPSYLRRRREKAKTRGGLRLSILPQASYQVATDTIHIPNHTAHPMGTGRLSVCRQSGTDHDLCFFPASGNRNGTGLNNRGSNGNYWSASLNSQTNGYNLNFNSRSQSSQQQQSVQRVLCQGGAALVDRAVHNDQDHHGSVNSTSRPLTNPLLTTTAATA